MIKYTVKQDVPGIKTKSMKPMSYACSRDYSVYLHKIRSDQLRYLNSVYLVTQKYNPVLLQKFSHASI